MKLFESVEPYLKSCQLERHSEPATIDKYRDCFRVWILPWPGNHELAELDRLDVLRLRQAMENRGLSGARQYSIIGCVNGTDITLIKELAEHQDIQKTAKYYIGVSKQTLRDAVRKKLRFGGEDDDGTAAVPVVAGSQ